MFFKIILWFPWHQSSVSGSHNSQVIINHRVKGTALDLGWCQDYVISVSDDRFVRVWKVEMDSLICIFQKKGHTARIFSCWSNPFSEYFVSVGEDGRICLWHLANEKLNLVEDLAQRHGSQVILLQSTYFNFLFKAF